MQESCPTDKNTLKLFKVNPVTESKCPDKLFINLPFY
jgi:hypothetical protein